MRKIVLLVLIILVSTVFTLTACTSSSQSETKITVAITSLSETQPGGTYSPNVIHIHPGTEVTWIERDTTLHTVTAQDGSFGSSLLKTGQTYTVRFNKAGDYHYYCEIHPEMVGEVIVQ